MNAFWRYLEKEKIGWKKILLFLFFWFFVIQTFMFVFINRVVGFDVKVVGIKVIFVIICSALIEEASFRVMPFYLSYELFKKLKSYKWATLISLFFISGFAFGFVHKVWLGACIKAIVGIFYGIVYLKLEGIKGKMVKPFIILSLFHIIHNIFVVSLFNSHFSIIYGQKIIPVL